MANPIHIPIVFATDGIKNPIYKTLQSGQDAQSFTWTYGAPLITMTPISEGGKPPKGQDLNGVINSICDNVVYTQNGNRYTWSQDVIDNYSGYGFGSIVQSDDKLREYRSLINSNTVNPNLGLGSAWEVYSGQGSLPIASSTTAGILRVLNSLTSTEVGSALSAAQGKILNDIFNRFELSALQNGYVKIPFWSRTFIVQWGYKTTAASSNFNIDFPNAALAILASNTDSQGSNVDNAFAYIIDRTSFYSATKASTGAINAYPHTWLAVGY